MIFLEEGKKNIKMPKRYIILNVISNIILDVIILTRLFGGKVILHI